MMEDCGCVHSALSGFVGSFLKVSFLRTKCWDLDRFALLLGGFWEFMFRVAYSVHCTLLELI